MYKTLTEIHEGPKSAVKETIDNGPPTTMESTQDGTQKEIIGVKSSTEDTNKQNENEMLVDNNPDPIAEVALENRPRPMLKRGKKSRLKLTRENIRKSTSLMPVLSFCKKLKNKAEGKKKLQLHRRNTVNK